MKVAVLIDGGHLRAVVNRRTNHRYDPDYIEAVAHNCVDRADGEHLFRIFYYDCAPYTGKARLPVSGNEIVFEGSDRWLRELAGKDYFAVRLGILKFRGFKPKKTPIEPVQLSDADFRPDFEQKGVDMRIGLDIAVFAERRSVDRIILITNDTDCIPAMKHGRKSGLQVVLMALPGQNAAPELLHHADFHRPITTWPAAIPPQAI